MSNKVRSVSTSIILDKPNPFTGASVEDDQPISYPLDSIEELFQWKPNDPNDHGQLFSVARVPHRPKVIKDGSLKTLVCDDNANGYHADRYYIVAKLKVIKKFLNKFLLQRYSLFVLNPVKLKANHPQFISLIETV